MIQLGWEIQNPSDNLILRMNDSNLGWEIRNPSDNLILGMKDFHSGWRIHESKWHIIYCKWMIPSNKTDTESELNT